MMDPQYKTVDGNMGPGRFLIGQNDPNVSNEEVVLDAVPAIWKEGRVMGKRTRGAQVVAAPVAGNNAGNGVFVAPPTADANVPPGDYHIEIVEDVANAGRILVRGPDGTETRGNVGAAVDGQLNFTLNDGAADFVAGDNWVVNVSYPNANGRWCPVNPAALDGTQIAAGILYTRQGITTGTKKATMVVRMQPVNGRLLDFGALTDPQKAVAEAQLAAQNIIVRY